MASLLDKIKSSVNTAFIKAAESTLFKDGTYSARTANATWNSGAPVEGPWQGVLYVRGSVEKLARSSSVSVATDVTYIPSVDAVFLLLQTNREGVEVVPDKGGILRTDDGTWRVMEVVGRDPANATSTLHCRPVGVS